MVLPDINDIMKFYSKLIEEDMNVDEANFYMAILVGYAALLWRMGNIDSANLSKYFEKLREEILEGPNQLNPYIMELFGIISEGLNDRNINELIDKLRMLLREERLDRLEV